MTKYAAAPDLRDGTSLTSTYGLDTKAEQPVFEIESIPGLVRMLLIDTKLFPGAISEVPLDGNTLVTGTNAAGKTSIIQLLPLFSGVSPSKISRKSQGKNFYGHYLPRSTSYVAFEFRHRDKGLRSVIIHAAPSDDKPMFRFVRSGLYEDMFVTDDNEFVQSSNLATHLRNRGYQVADRIVDTLSDYQSIIQGLPIKAGVSKDRAFLSQMVSQYTMSQPGQPLLNLDRVVYSMLKKDMSLQALEEMIAEKILHDDSEIQVESDRKNLESWPSRYQSYQSVMKQEDAARVLQRSCVELQAHSTERDAALGELQAKQIELAADEVAAKTRKDQATRTRKREQEDYDERKEELHDATSAALAAKNKIVDAIHDIETLETQGKASGIIAKVALADRKGEIEATRDEAQQRLDALSGAQSELTQTYDGLKRAAKDAADIERETAQGMEATAREQHDVAAAAAKLRHQDAEEELRDAHKEPIDQAIASYNDALAELGAAREAAKSPQVSQETLSRRDDAQRALTACSSRLTASMKDERPLEAAVRTHVKNLESIDRDIAGHQSQLEKLRDDMGKLEASKKPRPGSLLAHLRQSREDWGQDIGRVINPELLTRTDLNPADISYSDGLFGLHLDLSNVDPVAESDLSEIDLQIDELKAEIAEVEADIATARLRQTKAGEDRAKAQAALSAHQGAQTVLEQQKVAAEETLQKRQDDVEQEQKKAGEIAKARVTAAGESLKSAQQLKDKAAQALNDAMVELRASSAAEIKDIDATLKAAIATRKAREADIKARLDARHRELEEELATALRKKGVDAKLLTDLRSKIDAYEKELASIRRDDAQVQKWRHFLSVEMPKLPGLRSDLARAKLAHEAEAEKEAKLKLDWRLREQVLKQEVEAADSDITRIGTQLRRIAERLARTDITNVPPSAKSLRSLDEILAALNDAERRLKTLEAEIRTGVTNIAKVFLAETGSPAEQYLSGCKTTFASTVEGPEWVPALIEWFDKLHQQHCDNLMHDGRTITNNIKNGYHRLIDLDRQIKAENLTLQRSLNKNNVIAAVEDLSVSITSSIKKLEFMPSMERLANLHEQWMRSGQVLPPEGFTDAMTNLLTFWRGRDGISANLRDQIKIEGYLVEKGNRRTFHAGTDMKDISSNGVSYLVLTTILVGFVNMVRGKKPVHIVWALDELGAIDAENTRLLLDMLRDNHITLVAATPEASAAVNRNFDYRVKVIDGPRLADIKGAGRPSQRLLASPHSTDAVFASPASQDAAPIAHKEG